jgi:hypothetical protein
VITAPQVFRLRTVAALAAASEARATSSSASGATTTGGTNVNAGAVARPKPALPDIVPVSREQYRLRPTTTFRR